MAKNTGKCSEWKCNVDGDASYLMLTLQSKEERQKMQEPMLRYDEKRLVMLKECECQKRPGKQDSKNAAGK